MIHNQAQQKILLCEQQPQTVKYDSELVASFSLAGSLGADVFANNLVEYYCINSLFLSPTDLTDIWICCLCLSTSHGCEIIECAQFYYPSSI